MANLPLMPDKARRASVRLNNASGTSLQTLLTCAANGGFIEALWAASTHVESAGIRVTVMVGTGSSEFFVNSVLVPQATAAAPVQIVNLLDPSLLTYLDPNNIQYRLGGNDFIKVKVETTIPGAAVIDVTAQYGEYPL